MTLLIVGDASDTFLLNFIKHLKEKDHNIIVDVLNNNPDENANIVAKDSGHFRTIHSFFRSFSIVDSLPKIRVIIREVHQYMVGRNIFSNNKYDVVILFGLWAITCKFFINHYSRISFCLGVIMGSDYLKMDSRGDKKNFLKTLRMADKVLVGNPVLSRSILDEKLVDSDKIKNVFFGSEPLELLDKFQEVTREKAKKILGIKQNTAVIVCGYNANPNQQHLEIINELNRLKGIQTDILLIFPFTYGGSKEYKEEIKFALKKSNFEFKVLEVFISDEQIVILRRATDIFIQVQHTDSLSGSMQENLFCGNIVVTGSWLPYQILKERGIKYFTVDRIENLNEVLSCIIPRINEIQNELKIVNVPQKFSAGMWKNCINDWYDIIKKSNVN